MIPQNPYFSGLHNTKSTVSQGQHEKTFQLLCDQSLLMVPRGFRLRLCNSQVK